MNKVPNLSPGKGVIENRTSVKIYILFESNKFFMNTSLCYSINNFSILVFQ